MVRLENLQMQENSFHGTIPEAIQQLQSIGKYGYKRAYRLIIEQHAHLTFHCPEVLFLSSNQFSGQIPSNIGRLSRTLRGLYLSDNQFMGTIPLELCAFGAMEALFLDTNNIVGPIPECFGELTELRQLYLFQNQLTGSVPPELEELSNLSKSIEALAVSNFSAICSFSLYSLLHYSWLGARAK
jgi:hypothetical protein